VILAENLLALPQHPARDQVTLVFGVPSALAALARFPLPAGVRTVTPGGEALPRALVDRLYAQPGVRRVVNCYGPTECTVNCTAYEVPRDGDGEPPIGTASVAGARLSVRDPVTHRTAGEGELWVAGPGVARGYLNRPELTAERFVQDSDGTRWYRTGDLVRYDGQVHHYLGRLDDQVKVRGHRVELGEVQAALAAHPDVHHAVVLAPADGDGTRRLVGYVEPVSAPPTEPELRAWLRTRLPGYLLPSRIVVLDQIPLGPTGKADRAALPAPGRDRGVPFVGPRNPIEALVAEVVADTLGMPEVGVHDRIADLGGHSLTAARVVARLAEELAVAVPLGWYLADPTVAGLAARLGEVSPGIDGTPGTDGVTAAAGLSPAASGRVAGPPPAAGPVRHPGRRVFPLTDLQRELWLARQVHRGSSTTVAIRLRLTGVTAAAPVRDALAGIVGRHEVLRTGFEEWDDGPVAVVRPPSPVPVTEVDLTGVGPATRVGEVAAGAARHVFDLAGADPLLRATLIGTGPASAELVVAVDHAAFDGWSTGILMAELAAALAGDPVPGPAVQVGDVALFERELADRPDVTGKLQAFWRDELAGLTAPGELTGGRADGRTGAGARTVRPLDPELVRALDILSAGVGASRFAVYAAAVGVVLRGLTGEPDLVIGTGAALRDRPGLDRVIGPLIRILPVPVRTGGEPSFRELASRVSAATTRVLAHQDLPARELAGCAGVDRPHGAGLCPVVLSMQPADMPAVAEAGPVRVELLGEVETGMAAADLALFVNRTAAGTEVQAEYDVGLYQRPEVETLLDLLVRVLRRVVADPDAPVDSIELLDPDRRHELVRLGRGPELPVTRPATVLAAIEERARIRPDAVAVTGHDGDLSYAGLVAASTRVAAALSASGVTLGDRVGVCAPRDRMLPAALLGVLRAGAGYVPLDAEHPADRLAWLAADGGVGVVVSRGGALPAARDIPGVTVLDLDLLPAAGVTPPPPGPADLAYVLYTSGSTGRPKGVEVTHANLADHTTAVRSFPGITAQDAVLAVAPLSFDLVGAEIWSPLAAGARCVVVERDRVLDGAALAARIAEAKPTVAVLPPTLLRVLLAAGWTGCAALRVWCAGEALDPALVREIAPHVAEVTNGYGPTETTTLSTAYRVAGPVTGGTVPIGRALAGEWVYVMDPYGRLAPAGMVGELWIGGAGVARGYRGRPELTEAAFVPDPFVDGGRCYRTGDLARWNADRQLEYVGRADHQVKLLGQRIELGEIEAVLNEHPAVAQAVVVVDGAGPDASLVGYLVPEAVDIAAVEARLRGRLPDYLVPRRWVTLPAMPTTTSGKADRRSLPPPLAGSAAGGPRDQPRTELERFVAEVWTEVLGAADPGRDSAFFALGGNSFAATRVVARLRSTLTCDVPVALLFERPVLADFAAEVERLALDQLATKPTDPPPTDAAPRPAADVPS
jgi:amino acid adenylation domain-containing protein